MPPLLAFSLTFLFWAISHSLFASVTVKQWVRSRVGDRIYDAGYRLTYNVVALITFLPLLLISPVVSNNVRWLIPAPWHWLFYMIQIIGVAGLIYALWVTDVWHFAGLRQLLPKSVPEETIEPPLMITGPYRLVRHPLYFFSLLVLWFNPVMDNGTIIFNIAVTLYFYIGSFPEEKKLTAQFGDAYTRYQQVVPRLIPRLRWPPK